MAFVACCSGVAASKRQVDRWPRQHALQITSWSGLIAFSCFNGRLMELGECLRTLAICGQVIFPADNPSGTRICDFARLSWCEQLGNERVGNVLISDHVERAHSSIDSRLIPV